MSYIQLAVWASVCAVLAQDDPYCSVRYERLCQGKGPHVACQYPVRGAGPSCENYTAIIFTNELKQFILHYINRRRQKIASGHERVRGGVHLPKPEIMMLVQWDRELAYLAQRLADQCQFVHDDCRATVRYPYAGQTVGEVRWRRSGRSLERGARRTVGRVLDAWWGERRRVHAKQLVSPFVLTARGAVWGHFSQLAVWTLRAMGCGAVHHGSTRPRLLLVCDFSHTNMLGQRTISPGPLAACPAHTMRLGRPYPLLCASPPIHNKQIMQEDGGDEDEIDEDAMEEDDEEDKEESEDEDAEAREEPITAVAEDAYPTRPWPNRPVRPIIHGDIADPNNYLRREESTIDTLLFKQQNLETVTQSIRDRYRPEDLALSQDRRLDENIQSLREQRINKQFVTRHDTKYDSVRQQHRTVGIEGLVQQDNRERHTEIQSVRQFYTTEDTGSQYARQPYKTEVEDQHVRLPAERLATYERPLDDPRSLLESKPVKDRPSEVADYRYFKPIYDQVANSDRPTFEQMEVTRPIGVKDNFGEMERPPRPVLDVDRETRPVIDIYDDSVDAARRPIKPLQEDDEWRKSVTPEIRVSVKYRDNPDSLFRQKLNDELSSRNRQTEYQNRQPVPNRHPQKGNSQLETRFMVSEPRNGQSDHKGLHKTDNFRNAEVIRKGEYKVRVGYSRKELDWNPRLQPERNGEAIAMQNLNAVVPLKKQTQLVSQVTTVVVYRPTSLYSIQTEPVLRQRWIQTRVRPRRPGANALFQSSSPTYFIIRQSKKASLVLDKDEEEQLYRDTGFKLSTGNT